MSSFALGVLVGVAIGVVFTVARQRLARAAGRAWVRLPLSAAWWARLRTERLYARREREALPDGTRVRLVCDPARCGFRHHSGIWTTSWTPRRTGYHADPDDYMLTRETDGQTTYAGKSALEVVA